MSAHRDAESLRSSILVRPGIQASLIAALCAAALAPVPALAATFPAQSLIIPTQSSYQDPCGMVSTYGLIYSVLRANDGFRATGTAVGNFTGPITIHWVYRTLKGSPNRCVPTNLDNVRAGASAVSPAADITTTTWNDGCDFRLDNSSGVPATLVNNSLPAAANDSTSWTTIDTSGNALGRALAFPNYASRTVKFNGTAATNVTSLQYSGGAFVISASDAPGFLDLLSGTAAVRDAAGNAIDFSAFKTNGAGTCNVSVNGSNQAVFSGGALASAAVHKVNIHRAQVPFIADDNARMNGAPPKIGLLQSVDHDYADEGGTSVLTGKNRGDSDPILPGKIVGTPTGIKGTQLKYYLRSAGLDFAQAGGCPSGAYNDPNTNTYNSAAAGLCPNGAGVAGQIYDNLDAKDFSSGLINGTTNGKPNYSVIWAPHWEGRPWKTTGAGCDATCIAAAQAALVTFLEDTSTPRGFLAECATIGFLEGAVNTNEAATYTTACNPGYTGGNPTATVGGCYPNERYINNTNGTQSLTCQASATPGVCATAGSATAAGPLGLTHDLPDVNRRLDNCTDPTATSGSPCIHFAQPGTPFSQVGDYRWWSYSGGVPNYYPASGAMYTPSTQRLLYAVNSLNTATILTDPASQAVADNVTLIQRGGDRNKAQIVYLGGHNYTPDVAGTRIALNTLMALGLVIDTRESAFVGPTVYGDTVLVPTYNRITSQAIPVSWHTFDPSSPSYWLFPYHTGNLRVDNLASLAVGTNAYNNSAQRYIGVMPAPGQRNLFTYLGGHVSATDSQLPTSYRSTYSHGVAQIGWVPVSFDQSSLDSASTSYTDQFHIGPLTSPPGSANPTYAGMVAGGTLPSISDLQEALGLSITAQELGNDNGATLVEQLAVLTKLNSAPEKTKTRTLIQMVRGFCYSTLSFTPTNAQCYQLGASNVAHLGGLVHSQPAVVPASALIPEGPTGKHRPTVAYVGGLDGQLHAFYMPSDGNDAGYTGPATAITDVNPAASTIFSNPTTGGFSIPASGTELWAFIPPGQLPFLQTNTAQVDSSPAVSDVFGDFDGTGIRTWRTVLVASAGGSNREVFALDITNPLKPTLLWDIQSSYDSTQLNYAPAVLANDDTGKTSNAQAFNWQNRCRALDVTAGTCRAATYVLPPAADDCAGAVCGRLASGLFNYSHLGASQSVSVGVLRRNNAPIYAAFIATNEAGGQGIYVFGIDLVTGAKLWEWNNPYDRESYSATNPRKYAGTGNTPPAGVTVVSRSLDDQVNSVYVGDDEGSLWELDASNGINNTGYAVGLGCSDTSGSCNFPLNQAYGYSNALFSSVDNPQPISTLPTVFRVRSDIPATGIFARYVGQVMLAYGTAGTDSVASVSSPQVSGAVHLLPVGISMRDTVPDLLTGSQAPAKLVHAAAKGVVYEAGLNKDGTGTAMFPQALSSGNRVYGSIAVDQNGRLFFGTTNGSVTDIDSRGALTGSLYQINTAATSGNALSTFGGAVGGVGGSLGVGYNSSGQLILVVSTDANLGVPTPPTAPLPRQVPPGAGASAPAAGLLGWFIRKAGYEY